jgi:hypothetical protein
MPHGRLSISVGGGFIAATIIKINDSRRHVIGLHFDCRSKTIDTPKQS